MKKLNRIFKITENLLEAKIEKSTKQFCNEIEIQTKYEIKIEIKKKIKFENLSDTRHYSGQRGSANLLKIF